MEPNLGFSIGSTVYPGLSKLIEECGEVLQIAGKLIATGGKTEHWDGSDLRERMMDELSDLMAACDFFAITNGFPVERIIKRLDAKISQFQEWHKS